MMELVTSICLVMLAVGCVAVLVRFVLGPSLADRILALDTLTILSIAIIAVFAARTGLFLYVDIAVAVGLVGFLATVALARYVLSRSAP